MTIRRPFGELDLGDLLLSQGVAVSDVFSVLLDYLIRSHQHVRRDREANLLGRFEIDQLKLGRVLDRQVSRLGTLRKHRT